MVCSALALPCSPDPHFILLQYTMDEELRGITSTLTSFQTFHEWQNQSVIVPKTKRYAGLSSKEKALLDWYPALTRDLSQCVHINQSFVQNLAATAAKDWGVPLGPFEWEPCLELELRKVHQTLLQLVRDWSSEGATERLQSYQLVLDAACRRFPPDHRRQAKVLVPGCGTGRLVFEFVKAGFCTQGNEISYHMLMALGYMLNHVAVAHGETIFPFIHLLSYKRRRLHQLRPVYLPDESPLETFAGPVYADVPERFSMTAGSFIELYGTCSSLAEAAEFQSHCRNSFDVVATCFFLDTALNIIDYIQTIHHCLKDTGVWINMGPLNWHFEGDTRNGTSALEGMELSREELFLLIDKLGFEILELKFPILTMYAGDTMASARFVYDCDFWIAKKKLPETPGEISCGE